MQTLYGNQSAGKQMIPILAVLIIFAGVAVWMTLNELQNDVRAIKEKVSRIASRMPIDKERLESIAGSIRVELMKLENSHPHIFSKIPELYKRDGYSQGGAYLTALTLIDAHHEEKRKQALPPRSKSARVEIPAHLKRLVELHDEYRDTKRND